METKSWTPCSNSCAVGVKSTQHLLGHVALAENFGFIVSLYYRKICTMLFQQDCKVKTSLLCSTWTQSPPSSPPRFPPSPRSCSETFPLSLKWKPLTCKSDNLRLVARSTFATAGSEEKQDAAQTAANQPTHYENIFPSRIYP